MSEINSELISKYRSRGYSDDMLPKPKEKRTWGTFNYFTLWQGSVHNIPSYIAVGGFLTLGLSMFGLMTAIIISSLVIAAAMVLNGLAGSKYGVPFGMLLRGSYGVKGALLPGTLRGGVASIMWFGIMNTAGTGAMLILIGKFWPAFLDIGSGSTILGLGIPSMIAFLVFWAINMVIAFYGGDILNKFTAILNPLIWLVFGGLAIWAVYQAGLSNILNYVPQQVQTDGNALFKFFIVINSLVAVWACPAVGNCDFTQYAKSDQAQARGQTLGFFVAYTLFAITSVMILAGASIHYGIDTWNVLEIVNKFDGWFIPAFASIVILMTTISTNATANIIPAGYQVVALFPKLTYRQGVMIAGVISVIICPWKLMESQESLFMFLNIIGAMLGPVLGVMLAHYFVIMKGEVDLETLYTKPGQYNYYKNGYNSLAFGVTIIAAFAAIIGEFVPFLKPLSQLSWFTGVFISFSLYALLTKRKMTKVQITTATPN
ncbi:allantoin transporter [Vibrio alfacsensis]|uniref:allantoin transporter n=1 Tax=Vibrio alfacsensis TaxID=1074311 RepID=UPI001BEFAE14|nr:putative allantoin permease [Vibrio alfacsensis]BCN24908.1 allantoin permease [Vibrio alfacsensis]